ncbi:MAG: DUF6580 family putative transport protein [Patescibacteria group bacterium]
MESGKILKKAIPYAAIILTAVVARILPHAPNFAPIGGLALFTGYHLKNKTSWIIPLAAMLLSDYIIGFHSTMPYVYTSFFIIFMIGRILKKINPVSLASTSLLSSTLFFLITNYGVWATGTMYSKNLNGLVQSYIMGLPYFGNTVVGDFFYSLSFFYGFSYMAYLLGNKTYSRKTS